MRAHGQVHAQPGEQERMDPDGGAMGPLCPIVRSKEHDGALRQCGKAASNARAQRGPLGPIASRPPSGSRQPALNGRDRLLPRCTALCAPHKKSLTPGQMSPKIGGLRVRLESMDAPAKGCIFSVTVLDHALPGVHRTAGFPHRHANQAALRSGRFHLCLRALRNAGHPHDLSQGDKNRGSVTFRAPCGRSGRPAEERYAGSKGYRGIRNRL